MKKMTTMFAAMAIGVATMVAAPVDPGVRTDLRVTGTSDAFKKQQLQAATNHVLSQQNAETRSWTSGTSIYEARFQLETLTLCEMLSFDDGNGNIVNPTFDQLPYYCVKFTLTRRKTNEDSVNSIIYFYLAWPSEYIYSQVFNYTGETNENGQIPVDLRNYDAVEIDELFNNANYCRRFQESDAAGAAGDPSNGGWDYYSMLPNAKLGIPAAIDGTDACTVLTDQIASYIEMKQFSPEDNHTQFYSQIYYSATGEDSGTRTLRVGTNSKPFEGETDVQGWSAQTVDMPEFGDLYIFNTGVMNAEELGEENPFPADYPEVTALYFTISDKYVGWKVDEGYSGAFDADKFVSTGAELPTGQTVMEHANYIQGYMFADPKYGKDTTLDIQPADFVCQPVLQVDEGEIWWAESAPVINSLVAYGVQDMNGAEEPWSSEYGAAFIYRNLPERCWDPSYIGWGYPEGIVVNFVNDYDATYYTTSKGKIYYHYDPKNMQAFRELSPVGDRDGVETVTVDGVDAKILGGNGVITVRVNNDAEVAVYSLDGVCLKAGKAVAGEDVNVEGGKGVYVVKVGDKAVKVAL